MKANEWNNSGHMLAYTLSPKYSQKKKKKKLNRLLIQVIRMQFNEELHQHLHHNHGKSWRVFKPENQFQVLFRCACLAVI